MMWTAREMKFQRLRRGLVAATLVPTTSGEER